MKIPDNIKIGGVYYRVDKTGEPIIVNGIKHIGSFDYQNAVIKISNNIDEQVMKKVFLHEVMHAIINDANLEFSESLEERVADLIAVSLYQIFVDNKDIFAK